MTQSTMTQTIANVLALKSMAAKTASEMSQKAQAGEAYGCPGGL